MVKNLPAMQETWLQSLGWEDPWKRERLPTPVFWPGEFHGQRSLEDYSPRGCKETDVSEQLSLSTFISKLKKSTILNVYVSITKVNITKQKV